MMTTRVKYNGDIVISGISGSFPLSENMHELKENLFSKKNLVDAVIDPKNLEQKFGAVKNIDRFDNSFFCTTHKAAEGMDPISRILLEKTFEAILDAGYNPTTFKKTNTGVFVGQCINQYSKLHSNSTQYEFVGLYKTMYANRISHWLDINGPSVVFDTACSASAVALDNACKAIREGICNVAIVGGINSCINRSHIPISMMEAGAFSKIGCSTFDESADGYVPSETAAIILIQKKEDARRVYANIIHSAINCNGFSNEGISCPSEQGQYNLYKQFYQEIGINPDSVEYIEAHGTGTKRGDVIEVASIERFFCVKRNSPLKIGAVKSNMGHTEGASLLPQIAKLIIAYENRLIPPNINLKKLNSKIPALHNGKITVVTEATPCDKELFAINSFGIGGTNVHILISPHQKEKQITNPNSTYIPYLVMVSGRTPEAVDVLLNEAEKYHQDREFHALYHAIFSENINGHLERGYIILNGKKNIKRKTNFSGEQRPFWFIFSGMGSQWPTMGKSLMQIPAFAESICKSHEILKSKHIDLIKIITENNQKIFDNILHCFVGITAVQIALVDLLRLVEITPDGMIGHSLGETGCAYADGCMTAEQTLLTAYYRGLVSLESNFTHGMMAAIGESYSKIKCLIPPEIDIACHNGPESCTISGPTKNVENFLLILKEKNIFTRAVNTANIAYHSRYIANAGPKFNSYLNKIIPERKLRSPKWICTSAPESDWNMDSVRFSTPEYHTRNLLSSVLFEEGCKQIPENAITIEIAPHGLLQAILKRSLPPTVTNIPLTSKNDENGVQFLLGALGNLYVNGANPKVEKLYPPVEFPVSRGTPMIGPLIRWLHNEQFAQIYLDEEKKIGERDVVISVTDPDYEYLKGHMIDQRNLFPATAYLVLVWETLSILNDKSYQNLPIVFENVRFERATTIPTNGSVKFHISVQRCTGVFEILNNDTLVVTGRAYIPKNPNKELENYLPFNDELEPDMLPLSCKDVYKELRLKGYNYSGEFKKVTNANPNGKYGKVSWSNNFVTFMDTMAHLILLREDSRELLVPTAIQKIVINVEKHSEILQTFHEEYPEIPIYFYENQNAICSGGILMKGFKCNAIPRNKNIADPVLEKYQFVPYHSDHEKMKLYDAVKLCVHIIIENVPMVNVKAIEILENEFIEEKSLISKMIVQILGDLPMTEADVTIFTEKNDIEINLPGIKKKKEKLPTDKSNLFAITKNISKNYERIPQIIDTLKEPNYIITRESIEDNEIIENLGFDICFSRIISDQKILLLKKSSLENMKYTTIKITNLSYSWISELKQRLEQIDDNNQQTIILFAEKEPLNGILGLFNCLRKERKTKYLRCFFIMDENAPDFSLENGFYKKQIKKNLSHNVYKNGKWGSYRHILLEPLNKIQSDHAIYKPLIRGDLSTLKWLEGPLSPINYKSVDKFLIHAYYLSLNFRDIVLALGKVSPAEMSYKTRKEQEYCAGYEFSGKDEKGQRLMGFASNCGSSNLIEVNSEIVWNVPDYLTLEEAATIPVTYSTAIAALILHGQIKKEYSVLIHAGSGGVGQASINICLQYGCTIFTTVGTPEKVKFIKETFPQIPESHIGCSRDTSFEKLIMEKTNGRGVDIVLNSLSEDKLLASVRCIATEGKFLEIGKYDLAKNNHLELGPFLKGVRFQTIMLDNWLRNKPSDYFALKEIMQDMLNKAIIKPLITTVFDSDQLELAYRYIATGKHMGKVLIKLRDEEPKIHSRPDPLYLPVKPTVHCKPNKSYVIIGGLGGFGMELTDWLILRGAQNVIISSSKGIKNGYQTYRMKIWKSYGVKVVINTEDITTEKGVETLLNVSNTLAPVGGIFNVAVVLRDDPFEKQTEETFRISAGPKAIATLHLDHLSRKMCPDLDHFVVFSSVSCGRGNISQTNYGMANSTMERICEARKSDNLPALAIEWGVIGEVGLVANMADENKEVVIGGTLQQKVNSCLEVLNDFMKQSNAIVSSIVVAEKRSSGSDIVSVIGNIMGIKNLKTISLTWTLPELGIDSMNIIEIKQVLDAEFERFFSPDDIKTMTFAKLHKMMEEKNKKTTFQFEDKMLVEKLTPTNYLNDEEVIRPIVRIPSLINEGSIEETSSQINTTVFYFPGIEGHCKLGLQLSANLFAQVLSFQYFSDGHGDTFEKTAEYYASFIIERLTPQQEFFIIGHSFGTVLAMETVRTLERKGRIGLLWLIDGSPEYIDMRIRGQNFCKSEFNSILIQAMKLLSSFCFVTNLDDQVMKRLNDMEDLKEKKKILIPLISENYCSSYIADLYLNFVHSLEKSIHNYQISEEKLNSKAVLIRCVENEIKISHDYGLSKYFQYPVEIHEIDAEHTKILGNKRTAEIIMKYMDKKH